MKVQKVQATATQLTWLVLDDNWLPIDPITEFLRYITNTEKSPNTIRSYANHLKLFWENLSCYTKDWQTIKISDLSYFINWLRHEHENILSTQDDNGSNRKVASVNTILAAVSSFYRFHKQMGNTTATFTELTYSNGQSYKPLLHHIYKNKPRQRNLFRLKKYKDIPKTFTDEQVMMLLNACGNARDRFLLLLLYETGLRIGQALSLMHQDIKSWDNVIHIIPRQIPHSDIRNKSSRPNVIHVSSKLIQSYSEYLEIISPENLNEHVFVNLKNHRPLSYSAVRKLFTRLQKATGIKAHPHMFRHTHATNLLETGWDAALVQKRLGHRSIQTTLDNYSHVSQATLKAAYKNYLSKKGE